MPDEPAPTLQVEVVYSPAADQVDRVELTVAAGATVEQVLHSSGLLQRHPGLALDPAMLGIWGRRAPLDQPVRDGDRIELYRPLTIDPMQARRLRAREQRRSKATRPR